MSEKLLSQIAADLDMIKRLMIFDQLQKGHSQAKIASAIGTSQASISRMLAKKSDEK
ncbi:MAG: hypothetical protein ACTS1X_04045 [Parasphingopyxis sp.]|uniref:hypothetical protein n=1 Tax=Parasphingopyxis sp. TaxID=1920299 RepID=UPI003FA03605